MGWGCRGLMRTGCDTDLRCSEYQPVRLQFTFYLCPSDNYQRRERAFIHAEDVSGCLHSGRLARSLGRTEILSKGFSCAQTPGVNQ